ncbi:hypothetical protein GCWU000246_01535 [Jonquetella anthropi E3_33 E1]|nr:hypothetical protein GCWU000246_01535 [Jonquetella anthropi E3_33 E1]
MLDCWRFSVGETARRRLEDGPARESVFWFPTPKKRREIRG